MFTDELACVCVHITVYHSIWEGAINSPDSMVYGDLIILAPWYSTSPILQQEYAALLSHTYTDVFTSTRKAEAAVEATEQGLGDFRILCQEYTVHDYV